KPCFSTSIRCRARPITMAARCTSASTASCTHQHGLRASTQLRLAIISSARVLAQASLDARPQLLFLLEHANPESVGRHAEAVGETAPFVEIVAFEQLAAGGRQVGQTILHTFQLTRRVADHATHG